MPSYYATNIGSVITPDTLYKFHLYPHILKLLFPLHVIIILITCKEHVRVYAGDFSLYYNYIHKNYNRLANFDAHPSLLRPSMISWNKTTLTFTIVTNALTFQTRCENQSYHHRIKSQIPVKAVQIFIKITLNLRCNN